jgi:hypothetical protein
MIQELNMLTIEPIKRKIVQSCLKESNNTARNTYLPLLKKNNPNPSISRGRNSRFYLNDNQNKTEQETGNNSEFSLQIEDESGDKKDDNDGDICWENYKPKEYSLLK